MFKKLVFKDSWIAVPVFILAFLFVPFSQLKGLTLLPGDIGDARLNNYFLENIYFFLSGKVDSLWHLSFFYPYPYVLGFSDNLFGSAFIYLISRSFSVAPDTSFQFWFLFGYVVNYFAAYYALRRLKGSPLAATVGALIFAFALPTSAHAGHAQLHYRFALPLALVFFAEFLNLKNWRYLLISGVWAVWQFYSGVYIGFFTLMLIILMILSVLFHDMAHIGSNYRTLFDGLIEGWWSQSRKERILTSLGIGVLFMLLVLLFFPYLQVTRLYGFSRSWAEISSMLPRPQSYFLSDASYFWSSTSKAYSDLPMRHEHQMFIGIIPLALAVSGLLIGSRLKNGQTHTLMSGALVISVLMTLYVAGFSLWYFVHKLPLASAIRAMTRLDQAILFPVAYFVVVFTDEIRSRFVWGSKAILVIITPLVIFEAGLTSIPTSTKESWRNRYSDLNAIAASALSDKLPNDPILFFAQRAGPFYADELDAMWVSLKYGGKTLNGYSGSFPPGFNHAHGSDCAELPRRVIAYLNFIDAKNLDVYRELMSRTVPVGFVNCNPAWLKDYPK